MSHEYRPAPMSLAQRAALRRQEPRTLRQPARRRVYPLAIVLVLLVVIVVAVGGFEYLYRDRIYPKVYIPAASITVGGETQAAVAQQLGPFSIKQRLRVIDLMPRGHAPIFANADALGYRIDRGLTAWRAYNIGHNGSIIHRADEQFKTLTGHVAVSVAQHVDRPALLRYLFKLAPGLSQPPRPGVRGRRLDVATAERRIARDLLDVVGPFKLDLPFIAIPALPRPKVAHHHAPSTTKHKAATHKPTHK